MKKLRRWMVPCALGALLAFGCAKADKPMPLTKNNMSTYMQKMDAAIKGTTPREFADIPKNPEKQKAVMRKCFVEPMEQMGYSYDQTIADISRKVLAKTIVTEDSATTVMISDLLAFAKGARETELRHGFISKETKELLDRISQILPR